jgi:glutamine cyclotransferase
LTWRDNTVFVYDADQPERVLGRYNWGLEGWGITNGGSSLIISNGSSTLHFLDPNTFSVTRTVAVKDSDGAVDNLNELEFIDGYKNQSH